MLPSIPLRAESPRYSASLLFLPDLWAPARLWLPMAGFLGHRGWEGELLELRGAGGLAERSAVLAERIQGLPRPPVLIGHGAGGVVALDVARGGGVTAVVLVAPLWPGSVPCRQLATRWEAVTAIARGRAVPPPRGERARALFGEVPADLDAEAARAVLDMVRGSSALPRLQVPVLVVAGEHDPLLPRAAGAALAEMVGAEHAEVPGAGHWPLLPPSWRHSVGLVHRWLIRRLGAPLLELYAEAMADRERDD